MTEKSLSTMNVNTKTRINFYTQAHQLAARALFILWLLANSSPGDVFAVSTCQPSMPPATTTSPQGPPLASPLPKPEYPEDPKSFAGHYLAENLLSKVKDRLKEARDFLSKNKYKLSYVMVLSFMAKEVSRMEGLEGIQQILRLLGEGQEQEIVGLQHLRLQLLVIHEWLSYDQDDEKGIEDLEKEFQVMASLKAWFVKSFNHLRRGGSWHTSTGQQLLALLKDSLQNFDSVVKHAPDLLQLLRDAAKDDSLAVREAGLSLLADPSAAWAPEALLIIRALLADEDPYAGIATLQMLLSLVTLPPAWAPEALSSIQKALKDQEDSVRSAALRTLSTLLQVAAEHAEAALGSIQKALQGSHSYVRKGALETLSTLIQVAPEHA